MRMRNFYVWMVICCFWSTGFAQETEVSPTWDHKIQVKGDDQKVDKTSAYAYTVEVFDANRSDVEKWLQDELREGGKKSDVKSNVLSDLQGAVDNLNPETFDILAEAENIRGSDNVLAKVVFLNNGQAINPKDSPSGNKAAEKIMYDLGVTLNKHVVGEQLAEAEKELQKMESDYEKMEKGKEKMEKNLEKDQDKMTDAERDIAKLHKKLAGYKADLAKLEANAGVNPDAKALKKLSKTKKDIEKTEKKIEKLEKDKVKYEKDKTELNTEELPEQVEDMETLQQELESQRAVVEALKSRLASIK